MTDNLAALAALLKGCLQTNEVVVGNPAVGITVGLQQGAAEFVTLAERSTRSIVDDLPVKRH